MEHSQKTTSDSSAAVNATGEKDWKAEAETAEKRRRDTQSMLTPLQQENLRLKTELEVLQANPQGQPQINLSAPEQERLDDLMLSDPQAWRKEINTLEIQAHQKFKTDIKEKVDAEVQVKLTAQQVQEMKAKAESFFEKNTDLDVDTFDNFVPVGLQNAVKAGEITIEEYLEKGAAILRGAPVVSAVAPKSPDLGKVAGASSPSEAAKKKQSNNDWATALV